MEHSESIKEIAAALSRFQGLVENPKNLKENKFLKTKYAPLSSYLSEIRKAMAETGLFIIQEPSVLLEDPAVVSIETMILHTSGEWFQFKPLVFPLTKLDPQSLGATITYGRRYALQSVLLLSGEDEDQDGNPGGNGDSAPLRYKKHTPKPQPVNLQDPHVKALVADIRKSFEELIVINPSLYTPKSENFELAIETGEKDGEPLTLDLLESTRITLEKLVKHLNTVKEAAGMPDMIETPVKYSDAELDQMLDMIQAGGIVRMVQEFKAARKRGDMEACARIYDEVEANLPQEEGKLI